MKLRWRILYILLGSLFLLPSCTDEDLDTTMYGGREDTEFYNNLEEINQALTACYFYMKDSWNDMSLELMFINDCASDDCEKGGSGLRFMILSRREEATSAALTSSLRW